jgi:hypothetical protein
LSKSTQTPPQFWNGSSQLMVHRRSLQPREPLAGIGQE